MNYYQYTSWASTCYCHKIISKTFVNFNWTNVNNFSRISYIYKCMWFLFSCILDLKSWMISCKKLLLCIGLNRLWKRLNSMKLIQFSILRRHSHNYIYRTQSIIIIRTTIHNNKLWPTKQKERKNKYMKYIHTGYLNEKFNIKTTNKIMSKQYTFQRMFA